MPLPIGLSTSATILALTIFVTIRNFRRFFGWSMFRTATFVPPWTKHVFGWEASLCCFSLEREELCLEIATERDTDSVMHPILSTGSLHSAIG